VLAKCAAKAIFKAQKYARKKFAVKLDEEDGSI